MIEKIIYYVTSDGTKFYNEDEANRYELNCLSADLTSEDLIMMDNIYREYSPSTDLKTGIKEATFMDIKTEKALKAVQEMGNYLGISVPETVGVFRYEDDWVSPEDDLKWLNSEWGGLVEFEYKKK